MGGPQDPMAHEVAMEGLGPALEGVTLRYLFTAGKPCHQSQTPLGAPLDPTCLDDLKTSVSPHNVLTL